MNFIKEKKNILILLALYIVLITVGMKYRIGINDTATSVDTMSSFALVFSFIYILPTSIHLFFRKKLLISWFKYSLLFTSPILAILLLLTLSKNNSGFVGGEGIVLIPIALLTIALLISTPFYLHYKSKKLKNVQS